MSTIAEANPNTLAVLEWHKKFMQEPQATPALRSVHEAGIQRFDTLQFPHKKHEMYSFVNTSDLASVRFALAEVGTVDPDWVKERIYTLCQNRVIVFVDGHFDESLSDISGFEDTLKLTPLAEVLPSDGVQQYLLDTMQEENDVFAALNGAFLRHGMVLEVSEGALETSPIQVLYVSTGSGFGPATSHPRLLVKLGKRSQMSLAVQFAGRGEDYFVNAVQDFIVEEDAGMTYWQVQDDSAQSWHCSKVRVQLHRNSRFNSTSGSGGSRLTRHHYDVRLKEEGAELDMKGASVLVNEEQVHNFVRVHHEAPHCNSNQHFKNVINDKGRASFDGTVIVNKGAQLTNSDQLINNLMLSDEGKADNKPNLMIFADDVKCTHGSTVGQIDDDQIFYLKSRGLTEAVAQSLLTMSFVQSIIETVPNLDVVQDLKSLLLKKLEVGHD